MFGNVIPGGGGGREGITELDVDEFGAKAGTGTGAPDGAAAFELDDDGWAVAPG